MTPETSQLPHVSAIVISYNRASLIGAVLRAVQFADEVILIDKSSTDETREIAVSLCDRIIQVPWSPTVEATRIDAITHAKHDWILLLDDDEILNPAAVRWINKELLNPSAEVYGFPRREYIMGRHDPDAYYWPEHCIRLFRKGAITFTATVHDGMHVSRDKVHWIDTGTGAAIEHLSHPDVHSWIAKTNRYTSDRDRARTDGSSASLDLIEFARNRLDFWTGRSRVRKPGDYAQAAALLKASYDIVDRLKTWEEEQGLDGQQAFVRLAAEFAAAHAAENGNALPRRQCVVQASPQIPPTNRVPVLPDTGGEDIEKRRFLPV